MPQISKELYVSSPNVFCPSCGGGNNSIPYNFPLNYFHDEIYFCSECADIIDWWDIALSTLLEDSSLFSQGAASFLGAQQHVITKTIPLLGFVEIDLEKYGIPKNSTILYINYTPLTKDHAYLPLNWHNGEPFPRQIPRVLGIYGIPMPLKKARYIWGNKTNQLNIMVTFIPHSDNDYALRNLAKAYKAFLDAEFEDMIIPACVAMEDTLKQTLKLFNAMHGISGDSQKWEVMLSQSLPTILSKYKLPHLTSEVSELATKLYGLRNMLAHDGKLKEGLNLSKQIAAERLCAAIFITRYLLSIKSILKLIQSSGTQAI